MPITPNGVLIPCTITPSVKSVPQSSSTTAAFDAMGLVLLLARAAVIALDANGADLIVQPSDARQRFRRRPLPPGTVSVWALRDQSQ